MNPVMYIFLNKGAGMSTGKAAAQAAHAAVNAYIITPDESNAKRVWGRGGHYTKIVLEAKDADDLCVIERYLNDRTIKTALVIDEGRTEIDAFTPTALGCEIVDKDDAHVAATFGSFRTYRDSKPLVIECAGRISHEQLQEVRRLLGEGKEDEAKALVRAPQRPQPCKWSRTIQYGDMPYEGIFFKYESVIGSALRKLRRKRKS